MATRDDNPEASSLESLVQQLHSLELRMSNLESRLSSGIEEVKNANLAASRTTAGDDASDDLVISVDEGALESRIGEYGLAWLGSLVLLFGIAFLMTFILGKGYAALSTVLGYSSVIGIFIVSYYLRSTFPHMVFMFNITGHLLIFYTTLRIFFFTSDPLIPSRGIVTAMLLIAIAVQCWLAARKRSELLAGIALVLALATALINDTLNVTMPVIVLVSGTALFFFIRYNWWRLFTVSMFLVYLAHLLWLVNNPFLGHPAGFFASHPYSVVYLFAGGIIYSLPSLINRPGNAPERSVNSLSLMNGITFSLVIFVVTTVYFRDHYIWLFALISAFCLAWSVVLKMRTPGLFTPSLFACFSFMAMSIMVYGFRGLPDAYFYLALQSFLVVSMALWYRSRIIVVMNTILFFGILMAYLVGSEPVNRISFCFAFVAFLTARILNWKKERLTLKTDLMRNMYLFALFFTMLYAMYHIVPARYVTLSWTSVAAGYFILSIILKNIKYRWMAMATLLVTGIYLFAVDLAHLEVGYRVVAFLFLAVISISASLYYTKKIRKRRSHATEAEK